MIFTESAESRAFERMMTRIPKHQTRGYGKVIQNKYKPTAEDCSCKLCPDYSRGKCTLPRCPCIRERIDAGAVTMRELLIDTMYEIRDSQLKKRLQEMITERENDNMVFRSELHRKLFQEAIEKKDKENYKLMSALFLLTANTMLWNYAHIFVTGNRIDFDSMKPTGLSELGYTVFCAAKDLYTGSKHFTVSDLADSDLISTMQFSLICFGMAIRRFGLDALNFTEVSK